MTIHRGNTRATAERLTLVTGWARESPAAADTSKPPAIADARWVWKLSPEVREGLPEEWMRQAWDRFAARNRVGGRTIDRINKNVLEKMTPEELEAAARPLDAQPGSA